MLIQEVVFNQSVVEVREPSRPRRPVDALDPRQLFYPYDLGLMHTYSTLTCDTIAGDVPQLKALFRDYIPIQAVRQPCLMYATLAVSALHQIYLDFNEPDAGSFDRPGMVIHYREKALSMAKKDVLNLTEQNCHYILAMATMINIVQWGLPVSKSFPKLDSAIDEIIQIATYIRGTNEIFNTSIKWIMDSPLWALQRFGFLEDAPDLARELNETFNLFIAEFASLCESDADKLVFSKGINYLQETYRNVGLGENPQGIILPDPRGSAPIWLAFIPQEFLDLIDQRHPLALLALGYYAVALHMTDDVWWFRGWSKALMRDILRSLDASWLEGLEWPARQIGLQGELESLLRQQGYML